MTVSSIHGCVSIKYKAVQANLMMKVLFAKYLLNQIRHNRLNDCLWLLHSKFIQTTNLKLFHFISTDLSTNPRIISEQNEKE